LSYAPARARSRAPWTAFLLIPLLALASVLVPTAPASAAPGDVAGATLQWGVKQSFRSYITSAIAHGHVTGTGVDTATPYGWSGGTGSASNGGGVVAYPGTLQFQGHQNASTGDYALDITLSDVRVRVTSPSTAEIQADVVSRDMTTSAFTSYPDVVLATLDLSAGTSTSTATTVAYSNVPAVLTAAGAPAFAGFYGAGTALDPASFSWPVEQAPIVPTLSVSQTEGLDPAGATITITGSDYDTSGLALYGPNAGAPAGVYAQIGWLDSTWRPSQGAASGNRSNAYSVWVQGNSDTAPYLAWSIDENGRADFTWTVTIDKRTLDNVARAGATLAVFTIGAGGVVQAANELAVPISFADTTPTLVVSPTSNLDPAGDTLTVTGTNFDPDFLTTRGTVPGFYAQVGWIDEEWRPSAGAGSASRSNAYSAWVQGANDTSPYVKWTINDHGLADFSWTVGITKADLDAKARAGATLAVFTVGASGVAQAVNELAVPIAFAVPSTGGDGGGGGEQPPALTAGSLNWGVKASFRSYVTGPIAHGAITTSGVSTSGGSFVFPQAGDAQFANGTGSVSYSGSVRFTGHAGVLDLRLSDPQVRIDSATSGTLLVRVNGGSRVPFATLALASGTRTTDATGAIRYAGVPATITPAGASAFSLEGSTFYPAGTALDPVTFVVGAAGRASGATVVVASASAPRAANTPDAAPPATEGITVTSGDPVEGGEITAEADGFEPHESGILVVIYSEPTVLATDATADAAGRVSWTGSLPRGLTGEHTLTFQGSVDRGIVLDIAAAQELACTVSDARLVWGFKESFRAYIDGSIANGEWTTDGDVSYATPVFTWAGGTGGADDEGALDVGFTGSVRFTGHGGVLDTTIADPRIVVDGERAVLLLDVHGTTQEGEAVEQTAVEFAELDLSSVEATRDGELVTWSDVPAVLTAAGAAAFGTYPEGEELDPVTISATVAGGCATTSPEPTSTPTARDIDAESTGAGWPVWATVLIALLAAALVAAVVIVVVRRRRA
jgi:hypothetical protein